MTEAIEPSNIFLISLWIFLCLFYGFFIIMAYKIYSTGKCLVWQYDSQTIREINCKEI